MCFSICQGKVQNVLFLGDNCPLTELDIWTDSVLPYIKCYIRMQTSVTTRCNHTFTVILYMFPLTQNYKVFIVKTVFFQAVLHSLFRVLITHIGHTCVIQCLAWLASPVCTVMKEEGEGSSQGIWTSFRRSSWLSVCLVIILKSTHRPCHGIWVTYQVNLKANKQKFYFWSPCGS